jgi:prepilin peptidase CpaA
MDVRTFQTLAETHGTLAAAGFVGAFLTLAVVGIVLDVRLRRIPNSLTLAILAAGLIFSGAVDPVWSGVKSSLAGAAVGFGVWIAFYAIGVMGAGDVKFFAALSAWIGPSLSLRAAIVAALIGGVLAIGFLLRDRQLGRSLHGFALLPFFRSLKSVQVVDMTEDQASTQLPYGVALGSGAIIAFVFPNLLGLG